MQIVCARLRAAGAAVLEVAPEGANTAAIWLLAQGVKKEAAKIAAAAKALPVWSGPNTGGPGAAQGVAIPPVQVGIERIGFGMDNPGPNTGSWIQALAIIGMVLILALTLIGCVALILKE